jgi:hypothetical protein
MRDEPDSFTIVRPIVLQQQRGLIAPQELAGFSIDEVQPGTCRTDDARVLGFRMPAYSVSGTSSSSSTQCWTFSLVLGQVNTDAPILPSIGSGGVGRHMLRREDQIWVNRP